MKIQCSICSWLQHGSRFRERFHAQEKSIWKHCPRTFLPKCGRDSSSSSTQVFVQNADSAITSDLPNQNLNLKRTPGWSVRQQRSNSLQREYINIYELCWLHLTVGFYSKKIISRVPTSWLKGPSVQLSKQVKKRGSSPSCAEKGCAFWSGFAFQLIQHPFSRGREPPRPWWDPVFSL